MTLNNQAVMRDSANAPKVKTRIKAGVKANVKM
jgi:hypothetical protein